MWWIFSSIKVLKWNCHCSKFCPSSSQEEHRPSPCESSSLTAAQTCCLHSGLPFYSKSISFPACHGTKHLAVINISAPTGRSPTVWGCKLFLPAIHGAAARGYWSEPEPQWYFKHLFPAAAALYSPKLFLLERKETSHAVWWLSGRSSVDSSPACHEDRINPCFSTGGEESYAPCIGFKFIDFACPSNSKFNTSHPPAWCQDLVHSCHRTNRGTVPELY